MTDIYRLVLPNGDIEYAEKHTIAGGHVSFHLAFDQGGGNKDSIIVKGAEIRNNAFKLPIGEVTIELMSESDPKVSGLKFD